MHIYNYCLLHCGLSITRVSEEAWCDKLWESWESHSERLRRLSRSLMSACLSTLSTHPRIEYVAPRPVAYSIWNIKVTRQSHLSQEEGKNCAVNSYPKWTQMVLLMHNAESLLWYLLRFTASCCLSSRTFSYFPFLFFFFLHFFYCCAPNNPLMAYSRLRWTINS